jgi:ribonuclease III
MRADVATLESRIGHHFSDPELLRRALTHSSLANETRSAAGPPVSDNEQLEFLGDAILGFLASEALVRRFPGQSEGDLSRQKAHLVSATHLYGVARRIDLGTFLELGRSEETTGGRAKKNLLVDGLEALIAAVYLDGGMAAASAFVEKHVLDAQPMPEDDPAGSIQPVTGNYKGALLELARARKLPLPRFNLISEEGPAHSRVFTMEARIGMEWRGQGTGSTKKVAAQRAARIVYERLLQEAATVG